MAVGLLIKRSAKSATAGPLTRRIFQNQEPLLQFRNRRICTGALIGSLRKLGEAEPADGKPGSGR